MRCQRQRHAATQMSCFLTLAITHLIHTRPHLPGPTPLTRMPCGVSASALQQPRCPASSPSLIHTPNTHAPSPARPHSVHADAVWSQRQSHAPGEAVDAALGGVVTSNRGDGLGGTGGRFTGLLGRCGVACTPWRAVRSEGCSGDGYGGAFIGPSLINDHPVSAILTTPFP